MTPEPPKLPQNSPAQKEEKSGLPGLGSSPMLRVRGFNGASTLMERLKSLRKKDMAFIGAGLSVLLMAPMAEHFLMSPEEQSGELTKGFGNGSFMVDPGGVYDPGAGGFSPGGLLGQGSDVITPLNVRDPSALVMGPGATQKAPATEAPAAPSAAKPADNAWKDALAAAQKGASAATKRAALPMPHPKLAAGIRGLGAAGGGGGGSYSLPPISASNVPGRASGSNSLSRAQATPGYRGAAPRSMASGNSPESLRSAGAHQGDILNKGGSAGSALEQAARESMPGGAGDSGGRPGSGEDNKGPGQGGGKDNKSMGESLAFLRQKMEMEKEIELKWKRKMWKEFERGKMMEESIIKSAIENLLGKGLFEPMGKSMGDLFGSLTNGGPTGKSCICVDKAKCSGGKMVMSMADFKKTQSEKPGWPEGDGYECISWPKGAEEDNSTLAKNTDNASGNLNGRAITAGSEPDSKKAGEMGTGAQEGTKDFGTSLSELKSNIDRIEAKDAKMIAVKEQLTAFHGLLINAKASLDAAGKAQVKAVAKLKTVNDEAGTNVLPAHDEFLAKEQSASNETGVALKEKFNLTQPDLGYEAGHASLSTVLSFAKEVSQQKTAVEKLEPMRAEVQTGVVDQDLKDCETAIKASKDAEQSVPAKKDAAVKAYMEASGAGNESGVGTVKTSMNEAEAAHKAANLKAQAALDAARSAQTQTVEMIDKTVLADGALLDKPEKSGQLAGKTATETNSEMVSQLQAADAAVLKLKGLQSDKAAFEAEKPTTQKALDDAKAAQEKAAQAVDAAAAAHQNSKTAYRKADAAGQAQAQ
ncbi:MAG: hypothetical protein WCU88_04060 [Elusimicrobiota bacterium]|jgi:hypothetical protein